MVKKRVTTLETVQNINPHQKTSWQEMLEKFTYFKQVQGISECTIKDYKRHANYFFNRFPNAWESEELLKMDLMKYLSQDIAPATFNLRLTYLKCFLQFAVDEGFLESNPLKKLKKRKAEPRVVELPEDILIKLLSLPNKKTYSGLRDYALLLFILDTGVRPSETLSLLPSDFDLRRGSVTIPANIAKTRTSRTLPLLPPTLSAINKLISFRPNDWDNSTPLFCSCEGTRLKKESLKSRFDMYSKKLGTRIRPYDLRHAFAIMYLRSGGNVFTLQKTLGHTDLSMTKRYLNITGKDLREAHKTASPLNKLIKNSTATKTRVRRLK